MKISLDDILYSPSSRKTKPNRMMRENILPFFKEHNVEKVLDYGCGRFLRDSLFLAENGFTVDAVDLEEQVRNINPEKSKLINSLSTEIQGNNYDASLLNFVIQVLPTEKQRQEVLEKVYNAIKEGGFFVLSLRTQKDIGRYAKQRGIKFMDGYVLKGSKTFVRAYNMKQVKEILESLNLDIIEIYRSSMSYVALAEK